MAIQAGDVVWNVTAQNSQFARVMDDSDKRAGKLAASFQKHTRTMGIAFTGLATGLAASLGGMLRQFTKSGDEIDKMSKRTGIAASTLSEFGFASERSGASLADFENGVRRMQRAVFEASEEQRKAIETQGEGAKATGTYTDALNSLGLTFDDLAGKNPEEQFLTLADALSQVDDATIQAAIAQEIFGRSGTMLLPLVKEGADGIEALRQRARDLGLVYDQEAATAAAKFTDVMTDLKAATQSLIVQLGPFISEALIPAIESMTLAAAAAGDWASANPELAQGLVKATLALTAFAGVAGPMLLTLSTMTPLITGLTGAMGGAAGLAGATTATTGAMTGLLPVLGAVAGPVGLGLLVIAAGAAVLEIAKLTQSTIAYVGELNQLRQGNLAVAEGVRNYVAQLEANGKSIDRTRLKGLQYNAAMQEIARQLAAQRTEEENLAFVNRVRAEAQGQSTKAIEKDTKASEKASDAFRTTGEETARMSDILYGSLIPAANSTSNVLTNIGNQAAYARREIERLQAEAAEGFASGGVVPGFRSGGTVPPGYQSGGTLPTRIVEVGEQGPELVRFPSGKFAMVGRDGPQITALPVGSRVYPSGKTKTMVRETKIGRFQAGGFVSSLDFALRDRERGSLGGSGLGGSRNRRSQIEVNMIDPATFRDSRRGDPQTPGEPPAVPVIAPETQGTPLGDDRLPQQQSPFSGLGAGVSGTISTGQGPGGIASGGIGGPSVNNTQSEPIVSSFSSFARFARGGMVGPGGSPGFGGGRAASGGGRANLNINLGDFDAGGIQIISGQSRQETEEQVFSKIERPLRRWLSVQLDQAASRAGVSFDD